MSNYTRRQIRKALNDFFSPEEITELLFDYFPDVYGQRSAEMSKDRVIQLLLQYCLHHDQMQELVRIMQEERPNAFGDRGPQKTPGGDKSIFQYYRNVFRHGVMAGPYYPCAPLEYQRYIEGVSLIIKAILSGKYYDRSTEKLVEGALIDDISEPGKRSAIDMIVVPALRTMRKVHEYGESDSEKIELINRERKKILDTLNPIWRELLIDELPV